MADGMFDSLTVTGNTSLHGNIIIGESSSDSIGTPPLNAKLRVSGGAIVPEVGNSDSAGIQFSFDPGGGAWDTAYIRYHVESGENTRLVIGCQNDFDDRISFEQMRGERLTIYNSNVGVGTTTPDAKLEISLDNDMGWDGNKLGVRLKCPDPKYYLDVKTGINGSGNVSYQFCPYDPIAKTSLAGLTIDTNGNVILNNLNVSDNFTAVVRCADFRIGNADRRKEAGKVDLTGRALVDWGNTLHLNYQDVDNKPDWENVQIHGFTVEARCADFRIGNADRRKEAGKVDLTGRALVDWGNTLHLNYQDNNNPPDWANVQIHGNVGIGGDLSVDGNVRVKGDVYLTNADLAEDYDISTTEMIQAGTVMVLSELGTLQQSQKAYDKRVAGVISGAGDLRPGITLDKKAEQGNRLPLALVGKAYCKVDAQYGAIEVGDLLTTSSTAGHAMKASDSGRAFGTVIGKALDKLVSGQGLIPILVALQ